MSADLSGETFMVEYSAPSSCETYQDLLFRFDHTDNITVVFDIDAKSEQIDYALGLIFVGAIILAFFLIWATFLMVCMCIGHPVGFLSGSQFTRKPVRVREDSQHVHDDEDNDLPQEPTSEDVMGHNELSEIDRFHLEQQASIRKAAVEAAKLDNRRPEPAYHGDPWKSKASVSRVCFIFSAIVCFTFGILIVTQGITNLETSIKTVHGRTVDLNALSDSAHQIVRRGFLDLVSTADTLRTIMRTQLEAATFCPANPVMGSSAVSRDFQDTKNNMLDLLDQLADFQDEDLADLEDAMLTLYDVTGDALEYSGKYTVTDWQALVVLIPYTIFPAFMVVAALLALFDVSSPKYNCFVSIFILPLFIIMTLVAIAFSAGMSIAAGVNSDFCLPGGRPDSSPDELVLSTMKINGLDKSDFAYQVSEFYIKQCRPGLDDPLLNIRQYGPELKDNIIALDDFIMQLLNLGMIDELAAYCNRDFEMLVPLLSSTRHILEGLEKALERVLDVAKCGRIIPLYTDTVYDAGCQYSPKAVFWVFSCCLVLAFFGMVMITLRASMKQTLVLQDYGNHYPQVAYSFKDFTAAEDQVQAVEPPNLERLAGDEGKQGEERSYNTHQFSHPIEDKS